MKRDITEADLIDYLKTILDVEGEITLTEFKRRVRLAFDLSDYDLSMSSTRPGEIMYNKLRKLKTA